MLLRAKDHPVPPRTNKEKVQVDREKRYKVDLYKYVGDLMKVYKFWS